MPRVLLFLAIIGVSAVASAVMTYDESMQKSLVIGKWLSRSTAHENFLSATPIGVRRSGDVFFTQEEPLQTASDYGFSYTQSPRSTAVGEALTAFGLASSQTPKYLNLARAHAAWSFANTHDFSLSAIADSSITGWGLGYKYVFWRSWRLHASYQLQYSRASRANFFTSDTISNELSASLYLRLIDLFVGARHDLGRVRFESASATLQLPEAQYLSNLDEIETFVGLVIATSVNTRLTLQASRLGEETSASAKVSLRFDALHPTFGDWFRDPRALKQ